MFLFHMKHQDYMSDWYCRVCILLFSFECCMVIRFLNDNPVRICRFCVHKVVFVDIIKYFVIYPICLIFLYFVGIFLCYIYYIIDILLGRLGIKDVLLFFYNFDAIYIFYIGFWRKCYLRITCLRHKFFHLADKFWIHFRGCCSLSTSATANIITTLANFPPAISRKLSVLKLYLLKES